MENNTWRYYPFKHVHHKSRSYDVWFHEGHFAIFWPLTLLTTPQTKILKKLKKTLRDIIILHKCNINDNQMIYGS